MSPFHFLRLVKRRRRKWVVCGAAIVPLICRVFLRLRSSRCLDQFLYSKSNGPAVGCGVRFDRLAGPSRLNTPVCAYVTFLSAWRHEPVRQHFSSPRRPGAGSEAHVEIGLIADRRPGRVVVTVDHLHCFGIHYSSNVGGIGVIMRFPNVVAGETRLPQPIAESEGSEQVTLHSLYVSLTTLTTCSAVLAALCVFRLWKSERRIDRRATRGQCVMCGYDLRASPDRCPECGTVRAQPQSSRLRE